MFTHVNVAVFCHGETEPLCRLALAAAAGALEAGGEVRVRRVGAAGCAGAPLRSEPDSFVRDAGPLVEADPSDLDWADVALFGTATPYGVLLDPLTRFIDATVPLWRAGRLEEKVYGAFTPAASVHGGPSRRLVSLTDVFHHWGGIIVPLRGRDPIGPRRPEPEGSAPPAACGSLLERELAAARGQAHRATEAARALKAGHLLLAHVA